MHLHRAVRNSQFAPDLLAGQAVDDMRRDFPFPGREVDRGPKYPVHAFEVPHHQLKGIFRGQGVAVGPRPEHFAVAVLHKALIRIRTILGMAQPAQAAFANGVVVRL
ncbi:hypothetical protein D3C76_1678160 [compost metagenome]